VRVAASEDAVVFLHLLECRSEALGLAEIGSQTIQGFMFQPPLSFSFPGLPFVPEFPPPVPGMFIFFRPHALFVHVKTIHGQSQSLVIFDYQKISR
jgi:hypothetical protein